jgi:hypothetical protein
MRRFIHKARGLLLLISLFCGIDTFLSGQSPGANISLNAPFEPINRISVGVERGIGYGEISNINFNGVRSVLDFVSYKFDFAVGISENEGADNTISINTVIVKNFNEENIDRVEQFALFGGFGYTRIPVSPILEVDQINIPLGLSLGLDGPLPSIDINLSLSFRAQYRIWSTDNFEDQLGFGINVGGIFFPSGRNIGLRINYDILTISENGQRMTENGLSIGFQYIIY